MSNEIKNYKRFELREKIQFIIAIMTIVVVLSSIPESFAQEEEPSELWKILSELPERRTSSAAVTLDDKVYVIGGLNNRDEGTDTVVFFGRRHHDC